MYLCPVLLEIILLAIENIERQVQKKKKIPKIKDNIAESSTGDLKCQQGHALQ